MPRNSRNDTKHHITKPYIAELIKGLRINPSGLPIKSHEGQLRLTKRQNRSDAGDCGAVKVANATKSQIKGRMNPAIAANNVTQPFADRIFNRLST
jgi:hypothetical protein